MWTHYTRFLRRLLNRIRSGQRYTALAACALLRAGTLPTRILGIVGSALLLPATLIFAPRVLSRCPCLHPLRRT